HRRAAHRFGPLGACRRRLRATPCVSRQFTVALSLALALVVGFLALPMIAILVHVGPGKLGSSFGEQVTLDALGVTLETSAISLAVIVLVGTPAAYLLARRPFPG